MIRTILRPFKALSVLAFSGERLNVYRNYVHEGLLPRTNFGFDRTPPDDFEDFHFNRQYEEAKRYAAALPQLRWLYLGLWPFNVIDGKVERASLKRDGPAAPLLRDVFASQDVPDFSAYSALSHKQREESLRLRNLHPRSMF